MAEFIANVIRLVLSNYYLVFFLLGLFVAAIAILRAPASHSRALVYDKLLAWYTFFGIGVSNLWNFVMHVFFGEMAARYIGWADSPFQYEVGVASLGFGVVALVAAFRSNEMRFAAIVGPSIFALGAVVGHIHQMQVAHNFAPGNSGTIVWTAVVGSLLGFWLLWQGHRHPRLAQRSSPYRA